MGLCESNHAAPDSIISHKGTKPRRRLYPSLLREDMEPYERSELGEVGEGLCPADSAQPKHSIYRLHKLAEPRFQLCLA